MTATLLHLAPLAWLAVVLAWARVMARREIQAERFRRILITVSVDCSAAVASLERFAAAIRAMESARLRVGGEGSGS